MAPRVQSQQRDQTEEVDSGEKEEEGGRDNSLTAAELRRHEMNWTQATQLHGSCHESAGKRKGRNGASVGRGRAEGRGVPPHGTGLGEESAEWESGTCCQLPMQKPALSSWVVGFFLP